VDSYEYDEIQEKPELLRDILLNDPAFLEILFVDKTGNPKEGAARSQPTLANQFTILQSEWFQTANSGESNYTRVQTSPRDESYTIFAMPSQHGGVLAAQIQMDALWETVSQIHFGETGIIYIVNQRGQVIAHPDTQVVLSNKNIRDTEQFQAIMGSPQYRWLGNTVNFNGVKVVSVSAPVETAEWIVISELHEREAYAASRRAAVLIPLGILLMAFVAVFVIREVMLRVFLRPLELLHDGANEVSLGNLSHRIVIPRKDELGEVMAGFNSMSAELEKQRDNLQKAIAFEYESQRARELDILLRASDATSSSLDLNTVLRALAEQLLDISGYESCFISEWDKDTKYILGRMDFSRTIWRKDKRDTYIMSDFPISKQVLLTGSPIILQGNFEAEEKQWMNELGRTAVMILAIYSQENVIGLAEIAYTKADKVFTQRNLDACQKILSDAASWMTEPLSANDSERLFDVERNLLQASGGEICSFSEWDAPNDRIYNYAVYSTVIWKEGQGTRYNPNQELLKKALEEGKTGIFLSENQGEKAGIVLDGVLPMDAEAILVFPMQKGEYRIGVIELYDFNHRRQISTEQIALLRTIADKASSAIENARLLSQTQDRLNEKTALLQEKEVLLKEIHHRVKNNLQVISSLLNLQASQVKDTGALRSLRDSHTRVRSMALIHEKLYNSKSLARIDFGEYMQSLATDLFRSYQREPGDIQLKIEAEEIYLDLDQAIPCGLILNELMTNTLKYAFPDNRNGTIRVELHTGPNQTVRLRVADNGVGLADGVNIEKPDSLGWQLIHSLTRQLNGDLRADGSNGLNVEVSFDTQWTGELPEVRGETRN
jgi:two-component sensor histidine kinase/HAMP domain-containing protein